jgi:hypothetical protein
MASPTTPRLLTNARASELILDQILEETGDDEEPRTSPPVTPPGDAG